jgi:steroid delta-isomerase-like uncharacterized protein
MERRAILGGAVLAAAATISSPRGQAATDDTHSLAERFAATLSAHDITAFAELFAEDYRNHQTSAAAPPPPPGKTAKQGTIDFFAARLAGLPDLAVGIEASVAAGDRLAASFVYTGTHRGMLFGVPPTGRTLRFTSCDIFTIRDGRFSEHWGMGDIAGVLAQIKG